MNYLAKMRVFTLLLTLLGRQKSKPEVELWFMRKNCGFGKILKEKKKNVVFHLKQTVES